MVGYTACVFGKAWRLTRQSGWPAYRIAGVGRISSYFSGTRPGARDSLVEWRFDPLELKMPISTEWLGAICRRFPNLSGDDESLHRGIETDRWWRNVVDRDA